MEQNDSLQVINAGLDKFVFNVTHDLRFRRWQRYQGL